MKKVNLVIVFVFLGVLVDTWSQTNNTQNNDEYIQTAKEFLSFVGEKYGEIIDLKANIQISSSAGESKGTIFIKSPNRMRINFNNPKGQVINNNGTDFFVYIPSQNVALHQKKRPITSAGISDSFLTETGISLLIKNYLATYLDKPVFVPLETDLTKKVMKIKLTWRNTSQNFRSLILSIGRDNIIYQVDAITYNKEAVKFVFSDVEINKGIPDSRFDYDPPPTAHVIDKFLFDEEVKEDG